ncbi:hypothetical protein BGZ95_010664 [Linnemannia exigua]|uniref:Uncharacterized protein n=1 Tax=Linnemannia exigua TaxID=604196 RepID=A0AAD4DBM9_9FUNG|nr:hypothetical protein BGZ95_010664 [Linnemannia exigua]
MSRWMSWAASSPASNTRARIALGRQLMPWSTIVSRSWLPPLISELYFDGASSMEKEATHNEREKAQSKAEKLADEKISKFEARVNNGQRIRKQDFVGIKSQLSKVFRWDKEDRLSFIKYLRSQQWTVKESPFEADVHIANDCVPGDIVISGDSDLIIHPTVMDALQ